MKPSIIKTMKALFTILLFTVSILTFSQSKVAWTVSSAESAKKNPVEMNTKNISTGKSIFKLQCSSCHGIKADGKGLIASANLLSDTFQLQTDGAIFSKISAGRDKMPPFKSILSKEEDVWSVVNYLRALVKPEVWPTSKDIKIKIMIDDNAKSVTAFVSDTNSEMTPIRDVDVHFYIQRDFGLMSFGEKNNPTDDTGYVTVNFPEKVIGDEKGKLKIIVKVEDNFLYNDAKDTVTVKWGVPFVEDDTWFDTRSLWGTGYKIPIWLFLMIVGIFTAVWTCIIYVVVGIFKIKKAGKIFFK